MLFSFPEETLLRIIQHAQEGRSEGRWLEYGGGLGHFAHLIHERLPTWSVVLSDMNRDSLAFAAETFQLATLPATPEALEGQRFDVISMVASLEHVARPHPLLERLLERLAPGGLLVLAVPRFSPLNRAGSKDGSASVTPPYHLSHFDERSLARLLARLPALETEGILVWQDPPNAFKLTDLVKTWRYWRIEVPTTERKSPRSGTVGSYSPAELRWLGALGTADAAVEDLIFAIDGGLHLTMIAKKRCD
jgi:SAM-dependent methyltransferase